MLKAVRQFKEKMTAAAPEDAADMTRLKEIQEAAAAVAKTVTFYVKSLQDYAANALALHVDLANLYPANEKLSLSIATLNSTSKPLQDAPTLADVTLKSFERPLASIIARTKELMAKAEERQVCRAEISHYREKVTRLANDGLSDVKSQSKAESNTDKLHRNQKRFQELDEELSAAMAAMDRELADVTSKALSTFMAAHASFATGLSNCYNASLNAAASAPSPKAPATAAAAAAASSPSGGAGGAAEAEEAAPEEPAPSSVSFAAFLGGAGEAPAPAPAADDAAWEAAAAGGGEAEADPKAAEGGANPFAF